MATSLPLEDREQAALVRVEQEFERRAHTSKPWTYGEFLDRIEAVHVRYTQIRQARLDKARQTQRLGRAVTERHPARRTAWQTLHRLQQEDL